MPVMPVWRKATKSGPSGESRRASESGAASFTAALMWSRILGTMLLGGSTTGRQVRQYAMPSFSA
jgi:hypothetical protein